MSYLLDTNIVSAHLRRPSGLTHRFIQHSGRLSIPTLVLAELYAWAHGRDDPTPVLDKILHLLDDVELLGFEQESAERFGIIRTPPAPCPIPAAAASQERRPDANSDPTSVDATSPSPPGTGRSSFCRRR
jgi:hypothetical protein